MNLLEETVEDIRHSGHTSDDIVFIGSLESGHACTWDNLDEIHDKISEITL